MNCSQCNSYIWERYGAYTKGDGKLVIDTIEYYCPIHGTVQIEKYVSNPDNDNQLRNRIKLFLDKKNLHVKP